MIAKPLGAYIDLDQKVALAPGFLRGLFGGLDGAEATVYPTGPKR